MHPPPSNPYESEQALAEYLFFHYGAPETYLPFPQGPQEALNFPMRCAQQVIHAIPPSHKRRALDLGCGVGRTSFELARVFTDVLAIDFSHRFIDAATRMQTDGSIHINSIEEGDITTPVTLTIDPAIDRQRVTFQQGDASDLPAFPSPFDAVLLCNLIDRLAAPETCLRQMAHLVTPGGLLFITSPYTWMESFTPKSEWLGGHKNHDAPIYTQDRLKELLAPHFTLLSFDDIPFLIREHRRKYQWSIAEAGLGNDVMTPDSEQVYSQDYQNDILTHILNHVPIPPSASVLDLGCGRGHFSTLLHKTASLEKNVIGVDIIDDAPIPNARDRLTFIRQDGMNFLRQCTESFDLIIMKEMIHLFTSSERDLLPSLLAPLLRPQGALAVITRPHETCLPIYEEARNAWREGQPDLPDLLHPFHNAYSLDITPILYQQTVMVETWIDFIESKPWSVFQRMDETKHREGIAKLRSQFKTRSIDLVDELILVIITPNG